MGRRVNVWFNGICIALLMGLMVIEAAAGCQERQDAASGEKTTMVYDAPPILEFTDGRHVAREEWPQRRLELVDELSRFVYGRRPDTSTCKVKFQRIDSVDDDNALGGAAVRRQVKIEIQNWVAERTKKISFDLLIYLPRQRVERKEPVPLFVGLNFYGNHTIHHDEAILLHESWVPDNASLKISGNRVDAGSRGSRASRWPVEMILREGFGLATIYCGDIDPDFHDSFQNGIHPLFSVDQVANDERWGTISGWAWGLSRAMDYFETDSSVDEKRVAVIGHSRLGKTALWAGATDPRFAITISNNSGCGGAALSRREKGETIEKITERFPHWFCSKLAKYKNDVQSLPVDQHWLISSHAPRPVYVASATEDSWADPEGEFLSLQLSRPAYRLLGEEVTGIEEMPLADRSVGNVLGYHIRTGKHDLTAFDWEQFIRFCRRHLDQ